MNTPPTLRALANLIARAAAIVVPGVIFVPIFSAVSRPLVDDSRSMYFPTADGVITTSEPKRQQYGSRFDWVLAYSYTVDGRSFTSQRYASTGHTWYYEDDVDRLVAAFPVGARVPVAYDPDSPADAVLRPGQAGRLFERVAVVLVVLGAAGVCAYLVLFTPWRSPPHGTRAPLFDAADPRHVERTREGLFVRLPPTYVVHPALAIAVALSVVLIIARTRPTPPDPYPWWTGFLIVVAAPAFIATLFGLVRYPSLTLDTGRKRLLFHPGWPWREIALRFAEVNVVGLSSRTERQKNRVATYYRVWLGYTLADNQREVILCEYEHVADADALVLWLREVILGVSRADAS